MNRRHSRAEQSSNPAAFSPLRWKFYVTVRRGKIHNCVAFSKGEINSGDNEQTARRAWLLPVRAEVESDVLRK